MFDTAVGNGWYSGGYRSHNFVFPEDLATFVPDHDLVVGSDPIDSYDDLPYPQAPDGGIADYNNPESNPNPYGVAFDTTITRITRAGYDSHDKGSYLQGTGKCCWNDDSTYFLAYDWDADDSAYHVYIFNASGKRLRRLNKTGSISLANVRWALINSYWDGDAGVAMDASIHFYCLEDTAIVLYTIDDSAVGITALETYTITGYKTISFLGEHEMDKDGRLFTMKCQQTSDDKWGLILWDALADDVISNSFAVFDDVDMSNITDAFTSPSMNYILVRWSTAWSGLEDQTAKKGWEVYDQDFSRLYSIPIDGPACCFQDSSQDDWLCGMVGPRHKSSVWNFVSAVGGDIVRVLLEDSTTEMWSSSATISSRVVPVFGGCGASIPCCDYEIAFPHYATNRDYLFVTFYKFGSLGWDDDIGKWYPLYGELVSIPVGRTVNDSGFLRETNRRICHTRPRKVGAFSSTEATPHFNINRIGNYAVFQSVMGQSARDLYLVQLYKNDNYYEYWVPSSTYFEDPMEVATPSTTVGEIAASNASAVNAQKLTMQLYSKSESRYLGPDDAVSLTLHGIVIVGKCINKESGIFVFNVTAASGAGKLTVNGVDDATLGTTMNIVTLDILD